jgi:hypothetical protein
MIDDVGGYTGGFGLYRYRARRRPASGARRCRHLEPDTAELIRRTAGTLLPVRFHYEPNTVDPRCNYTRGRGTRGGVPYGYGYARGRAHQAALATRQSAPPSSVRP